MSLFLLFIAFVAWEDVRRPFWLQTLAAFFIWGACNIGSKHSIKVIRNLTRTVTYIVLLLKELSFLADSQWVSAQSVSSTRTGYSVVLLTLLAGWDASPRNITAAMAWGVMSAAKYTHLHAGTLNLGLCLGWQGAGIVLIVLPRLAPVKALVNSLIVDFQDPGYGSLLPVMTAAGCVSDALLLAVLFYMLPFLLVTSSFGPNLPHPSGTTQAVTLQDMVCGTPPTTSAAVNSVQTILAWLPCSLLYCMVNVGTSPSSWAAAIVIVVSLHRRQILTLIRLAQRRLFLQDIGHDTLDPVPFNLVVYLGPMGALTVWTAILLASYAGFVHMMWQLLVWSTPTLALGPWAGALYLGTLVKQAWGWALTLCWAAPILYSFDMVCQLGVKVATLQDRVTYLEDRLKVAGLISRAAVAGGPVAINIAASAIISAAPDQDPAAPAPASAAAAVPAESPPPAVFDAAVPTPAAIRSAAAAPAAPTPAADDEAAALAPRAAAAPVPAAQQAAEGGDRTRAALALAGADGAAVTTPAGADGGKAKEIRRMRRAYAAAKKRGKKLVPKMGRRQPPGQEAPQAQAQLLPSENPGAARPGCRPFRRLFGRSNNHDNTRQQGRCE